MHGTVLPPQYVFMAWCLVKRRDNFTTIVGHSEKGGLQWQGISIVGSRRADRETRNSSDNVAKCCEEPLFVTLDFKPFKRCSDRRKSVLSVLCF
jgi:hypothetical protein